MSDIDPQSYLWLVKELAEIKRVQRRTTGGHPGLHSSSIEGGSIDEYTVEGSLVSQVGEQFDGTHTTVSLNGPNPPMPTLPVVSSVPGVVEFRWNGKFEADITSPMDFKHVAGYVVHVGDPIDLTNQAGVLTGELGDSGQIQVDGPGVYDVYLVAWSQSGKHSDYAGPVSVAVPETADAEALQAELDAAQAAIDAAATKLEDAKAELGGRLDTAEADLSASRQRIDAAETELTNAFGQLETVDNRIAAAKAAAQAAASADATAKAEAAEAAAATTAAADAKAKADAAQAAAIAAAAADAKTKADKALADAKADATTKADAAKQAAITAAASDAQAKADAARDAAVSASEAALQAAGKAVVRYQPNAPEPDPDTLWFDTSDGTIPKVYVDYGPDPLTNMAHAYNYKFHDSLTGSVYIDPQRRAQVLRGVRRGTSAVAIYTMQTLRPVVNEGETATATLWARASLTGNYSIRISWGGSTDASIVAKKDYWLTSNTWTKMEIAGTAPTTTWAGVDLLDGTGRPVGEWMELSEPTLVKGEDPIPAYFDGDFPGAEWAGAPRASQSTYEGPGWFSIRDEGVLSATSAAAKAQADATKAISDAAAAQTAAGAAKTTADSALTMAGSKSKVYYSTSAPSGTGTAAGDLWRRRNAGNEVIGEWQWSGSAWVAQTVSGSIVSNMDIGYLTAGAATMSQALINKLVAGTASFQTADVKNLFATTGTMSEAVITKLFTDVVKARIATAEEFIGGNAILTESITAPKIVASEELMGKLAEFLRVNAQMIEVGALDGQVITGAIIQSPGDGAGYQLTEGGYTSRDDDGNVTVRLPSDGSEASFRGDLEARSLTASGKVSIQAPDNEIASGASVSLAAGVGAPASPPSEGTAYTQVAFPPQPEAGSITGLAFADGLWWRAVDVGGFEVGDRLEGLDAAGNIVRSYPILEFWAKNGLTAIGDELFLLGRRSGRNGECWVKVYSAITGEWLRLFQYSEYGTGTYQPGIGTDGTNIMIAQCWADGNLAWRRYNKTTGAWIDYTTTGTRYNIDVNGIFQGAADFGATRVAVSRSPGAVSVFTTAGANVSNAGWWTAGFTNAVGFAYAGGKFHQLTAEGNLVTYSGFQDAEGDTSDWWVAQTWVGPSGEETPAGPAKPFKFMRRSEEQFTAGAMPAGVVGSRFYLARKSSAPVRTDLHLVASGTSGARLSVLPSNWATFANPPATNTFTAEAPGVVKSGTGNFVARGDGSGSWGPLTFNADGSMTSSAIPSWIPVTTFIGTAGPQSWGYAPAYRVWPDGKVEWRGIVAGSWLTTGSGDAITIPAAARPPIRRQFAGATNSASVGSVVRLEFGPGDPATTIVVYVSGANRTWFSLDGISYYRE